MIYFQDINQLINNDQVVSRRIELKEQVKINQYLNVHDASSKTELVYPLFFNIRRNTATDSFKLYFGLAAHDYMPKHLWIKMNDYKTKEIDNKVLMWNRVKKVPFNAKETIPYQMEPLKWNWVPNSSLSTNSFSKLHNMTIGMDDKDGELDLGVVVESEERNDKVQVISSKDEISFSYFENLYLNYRWVFIESPSRKPINLSSQGFVFKPEKLDLINGNRIIGRIYCKSLEEAKKVMNNGIKPEVKHYSTSAYGSKNLHAHAEMNKVPIRTANGQYEIARVLFDEYTYFDYEKQKAVVGFKKESQKRELIPHNYEGSYERNLVITFNSVYKDMDIHIVDDINQPILSEDGSGLIQLRQVETPKHIYESTKMQHEIKNISKEGVKEIPTAPKKFYWQEYLINTSLPEPFREEDDDKL